MSVIYLFFATGVWRLFYWLRRRFIEFWISNSRTEEDLFVATHNLLMRGDGGRRELSRFFVFPSARRSSNSHRGCRWRDNETPLFQWYLYSSPQFFAWDSKKIVYSFKVSFFLLLLLWSINIDLKSKFSPRFEALSFGYHNPWFNLEGGGKQ